MQSVKASAHLGLLTLALAAGTFATAQDSGWQLGANLGKSQAKLDDGAISRRMLGSGLTVPAITDRDHSTGFKVFAGYQFNRYFTLEGGYFDLGKFGFNAATLPTGTLDGEIKVKGLNLDGVFSIPFTEKFSGFLRAGVIRVQAKDTFRGTGSVIVLNPDPSKLETSYKYGAGLQYNFTRSFALRAEVERYRVNDGVRGKGDIDLASAGVLFRFGRRAPAAPAPYVAPQEASAAPAPVAAAPVPVAAPAPVRTQDYCTILDLTFEIDRDTIQRDDLEKLAVVGTFLTKYPGSTAVIEGHSDNVGTYEHNLTLSRTRAENVVTYLVDTLHIDRSRLQAVGYADSRPVADNGTEEGKRQNRRINAVIACVQDIEGLMVAPARITMALELEFDLKKDQVLPKHHGELNKVVKFLKANPTVTATVEGHAGQVQVNETQAMAISKRRAQNVVAYLVETGGIAPARLKAEGFGNTRRYAYSNTPEGQQENRRVNIIFDYPKK